MTQYDNTNRGALFKNDRKEKESHPDYKGSINIDGVEYWLSGWKKESAKGPLLSLSVQPKDQQAAKPSKPASKPAADFDDDLVPF